MRICPSCQTENADDLDFCASCNTYLRWEPTQYAPAVASAAESPAPPAAADAPPQADAPPAPAAPEREQSRHALQRLPVIKPEATRQYEAASAPAATAAPPEPAPPPPSEPDTVIVTLRLPGEEGAGSAEIAVSVVPGTQASVLALVRNQSGIVDNYDLVVDGMPAEWWTITPPTVYLVPFGAPGGDYEQEVELRFHPPRTPEAEARPWPVRIVATSKAHERPVGGASATVTIAPYQELETEMRPERAGGRRKASFAIAVRNRANAPANVAFNAVDSEGAIDFAFGEPSLTVPPGKRVGSPFVAKPKKMHWYGRPVEHRFQVAADPVTAPAAVPDSIPPPPSIPRQGVFRHKPWIPWWLPIVLPILIAAGIAIWLLWPNNTVVPSLKGLKVSAAQTLLAKKGLQLGQTQNGDPTGNPSLVGTIESQSPLAKKKVKKGSKVDVTVFVGNGMTVVPKISGKTINQAKAALEKANLQMGKSTPDPKNPDKDKVINQSPAANQKVKQGSAVDVFIQIAGGGKNGTGTGTTNAPTTPQVKGKNLVIPALAGQTFAGAGIRGLQKLHLPIQETSAISTLPVGTIVGQTPAPGTEIPKDQKQPVSVSVSAGFPRIAYDDETNVFVMNGADGSGVKQVAAGTEPTWQPKTNLIAYVSGGKIVEQNLAQGLTSARTLTAGPADHRPVFSPNGAVVAFIRDVSASDGDLCFVPAIGGTPSCLTDPTINVDRPTWSPDGKAILTIAAAKTNPTQLELFLYTTATPFAAQATAWVPAGLQEKPKRPGDDILYVSWSPDGKRVALASNWGSSTPSLFKLFLAPWSPSTGLGPPKPVVPSVAACTAAFRQDGKELAITQSNDCESGRPAVARVNPDNPQQLTTLQQVNARFPAWQFLPNLP